MAKPFLKWAGGKRQLLGHLEKLLPHKYGKYIEPFVGGGALFFHAQPKEAILADSNYELINTYIVVRDQLLELIGVLQTYPYSKDFYYRLRSTSSKTLSHIESAARFIYLNRTCFNGLYRVNKKGEFNVPFGSYKNPRICDIDTLSSASIALKSVQLQVGDYISTLEESACPGDFVFLDPPYYPVSKHSDFKRYTKDFFYEDDHYQLFKIFEELSRLGVYVILTNSSAPFIRELYKDFYIERVSTKRNINVDSSKRSNGNDLIVLSNPLFKLLDNLPNAK